MKCEESVCLALHCTGVACRSCSWTTTLQQLRTKHARTGLAGARRMQVLEVGKGSLEVKLPTIWTDEKQSREEAERRERLEERRVEEKG